MSRLNAFPCGPLRPLRLRGKLLWLQNNTASFRVPCFKPLAIVNCKLSHALTSSRENAYALSTNAPKHILPIKFPVFAAITAANLINSIFV
jgi:hypothetical protein